MRALPAVAAGLGLVVLGVAVGTAGIVLHQGFGWLLLALGGSLAVLLAVPPGPWRLAYAVGYAAPLAVVWWGRPEGDVVLIGWHGTLLICAAAVWLGAGIGSLPAPRGLRRPRTSSS